MKRKDKIELLKKMRLMLEKSEAGTDYDPGDWDDDAAEDGQGDKTTPPPVPTDPPKTPAKGKPRAKRRYDSVARGTMKLKRSVYIKDKDAGNKFRDWIYTNKPHYPETVLSPAPGTLDKEGPIDNEIFAKAWVDHGEEYLCNTNQVQCGPGAKGFKAAATRIRPQGGVGKIETTWGFKEHKKKGGEWSHKSRKSSGFLQPVRMQDELARIMKIDEDDYHKPLSNITTIEIRKPFDGGLTPEQIKEIFTGRVKLIINNGEITSDQINSKFKKRSNTARMMVQAAKDHLLKMDQEQLNKFFNIPEN